MRRKKKNLIIKSTITGSAILLKLNNNITHVKVKNEEQIISNIFL